MSTPGNLLQYFRALDDSLFSREARQSDPHLLHYRLRARALEEKLTRYELGRALYHLAHRRGFLSNSKNEPRRDEKEGPVKKVIGNLRQEMKDSGSATLAQHISRRDYDPSTDRIRGPEHYLGRREQVLPEFEEMWRIQARHYPDLTDDLRDQVRQAIFYQRPLKTPARFLGFCELEREQRLRRAPMALLPAQRFRLLQKMNDLTFTCQGRTRDLSGEQRQKLLARLETEEKLAFDEIRTLLELPEGRFNFETFGEDSLLGNKTAARLAKAVGKERWADLSHDVRERLVQEVRTRSSEAIATRAKKRGYDDKTARKLSEVALEEGHCRLSRQALGKILPLMEEGKAYARARHECYPLLGRNGAAASLPPLDEAVEVRNPTVERALTEVRKVVNAVVARYGLPRRVRIELARDLKRNRRQREGIAKRIWENRKDRERAKAALDDLGYPTTRRNREKWLLREECGCVCPYTGRGISEEDLFGSLPQFQVEHVIPFSKCLDDSFANKTLCHFSENQKKSNCTPWEAYRNDPDKWRDIVARVRAFRGEGRGREVMRRKGKKKEPPVRTKLDRFQLQEIRDLDDFTNRQLTDTQYAARLAVEYVGRLYGAGADGNDPRGDKRVQAGRGQVTSYLREREVWDLNPLLGAGEKTREDHRQHTIDAVCIALTDAKLIKRLSVAAENAPRADWRRFAPIGLPWPTFREDVENAITGMVVSHRVSRKVSGALHKQTFYGRYQYPDRNGTLRVWAHERKLLKDLNSTTDIVDDAVRHCVDEALRALGKKSPKEAFSTPESHPRLRTHAGREVPIYKVRIRKADKLEAVGTGERTRNVMLESNHHMEVFSVVGAKGTATWESEIVSTYDAIRRRPVVQRDRPGFLFSLAQGEAVELVEGPNQERVIYIVSKITKRRLPNGGERRTVGIVRHADARMSTAKQGAETRKLDERGPEYLRKNHCRKVLLTPLGEVRDARD